MTSTDLVPAALAGVVGALAAVTELATDQYPQTFFLIWRSWSVALYALLYFVAAAVLRVLLHSLVESHTVRLEGPGLSDPLVQSLIVGVSAKAFFHIKIWNVSGAGGTTFPIGIETFITPFERRLLRAIEIDNFNSVANYVSPRAGRHTNLVTVKARMKANIPKTFAPAERKGIEVSIDDATSVDDAMQSYLKDCGRKTLERVFP